MRYVLAFILAFILTGSLRAAPMNIVRVSVQDSGNVQSHGTGVLIQPTLVITNWHVIVNCAGTIQIIFPDGFNCEARLIKSSRKWDLAILQTEAATTPPVKLGESPTLGDIVTVGGYGGIGGGYQSDMGKVVGFCSPGKDAPNDFFKIDADTRSGDSGGPILKDEKLVGILFGGSSNYTYGVNVGRMRIFLGKLINDEAAYELWRWKDD